MKNSIKSTPKRKRRSPSAVNSQYITEDSPSKKITRTPDRGRVQTKYNTRYASRQKKKLASMMKEEYSDGEEENDSFRFDGEVEEGGELGRNRQENDVSSPYEVSFTSTHSGFTPTHSRSPSSPPSSSFRSARSASKNSTSPVPFNSSYSPIHSNDDDDEDLGDDSGSDQLHPETYSLSMQDEDEEGMPYDGMNGMGFGYDQAYDKGEPFSPVVVRKGSRRREKSLEEEEEGEEEEDGDGTLQSFLHLENQTLDTSGSSPRRRVGKQRERGGRKERGSSSKYSRTNGNQGPFLSPIRSYTPVDESYINSFEQHQQEEEEEEEWAQPVLPTSHRPLTGAYRLQRQSSLNDTKVLLPIHHHPHESDQSYTSMEHQEDDEEEEEEEPSSLSFEQENSRESRMMTPSPTHTPFVSSSSSSSPLHAQSKRDLHHSFPRLLQTPSKAGFRQRTNLHYTHHPSSSSSIHSPPFPRDNRTIYSTSPLPFTNLVSSPSSHRQSQSQSQSQSHFASASDISFSRNESVSQDMSRALSPPPPSTVKKKKPRRSTTSTSSSSSSFERPSSLITTNHDNQNQNQSHHFFEDDFEREGQTEDPIFFMRDFDVRGVLGKGQFATVFHCRHKKSGEDCAIKRYDRPFRNRSERESLLNEAKILDDLREGEGNAYVTDVNTAWQEEGILYIWMELCDRGSLASLKDRLVDQGLFKKLPNSTIWFIVHDVSAGIAHMHQKNIVHLDIKPSNIFLSHSGRLKLGDFGTAIRAGEEQDGRDGDGRYLAPELLNSAVRDLEADLFSFGVMLYEWAGGIEDTLPSEGYEWRQLRKGIMKEIFPTHRDERLVQLTKELLSPEPGDRPSAESILAECDPLDPYEPSPDPILTSVPSIFEEEEEASMLSMTVLSSGSDDQRVVTPTAFSLRKS